MRAREPRQRLDLAGVVHAHFQHGIVRARRTARERQRHAPMIVVGSDRGVGFAVLRQRKPQRFLGAGLADRTGDADHLGVRACPRRGGERAQRGKHVGHDKKRRIAPACRRAARRRRPRDRLWRRAPRRTNSWPSRRSARQRTLRRGRWCGCRSRCRRSMPAACPAARRPSPRPCRRRSTAPARSCGKLLQCRGDRFVIAERHYPVADDLAGFMALAGDQQNVAGAQIGNRRADRLAPVADLDGAGRGGEDGGADGGRRLRCADCRR